MKTQTKTSTSPTPAPITFRQNVLFRDEKEDKSIFLAAGEKSPWHHESEVPERLRGLIGTPNFDPPPNTPNQYWTSKAQLRAEREAFEALNSNADMNPSLAAELEARDAAYLRESADRNRVETEIEAREEVDRKRLVAELEKEAAAKLKGYKS
jgi:hypothetical protein